MDYHIFLKIGNSIIKLCFILNEDSKPVYSNERLKNEIFLYYWNYISNDIPKKIDIEIVIQESVGTILEEEAISTSGNKVYTILYKLYNNKVLTFNHLSIIEFQFLLRYWFTKLLTKEKGLAIHCSAVGIDGSVNIFMGESGAGKSTIMKLLSNTYLPLADDNGFLLCERKKYYFLQSPFLEKEGSFIYKRNYQFPLSRVFFIKKSKEFIIKKILNKKTVIEEFIPHIYQTKEDHEKQIKNSFNFISSFDEFYYLYFDKDENELVKLLKLQVKL